jgi:hypothetical protein
LHPCHIFGAEFIEERRQFERGFGWFRGLGHILY